MLTKTEVEFRSLRNKLSSEGFRCSYRRHLDRPCPQGGYVSLAKAIYKKVDEKAALVICLNCGHEVSHTRVTQLRLL